MSRRRSVIAALLRAAVAAFAAFTLLSLLGGLHWLPDLLANFRLHLAVIAAGLALLCVLARCVGPALVASLCLAVHLVPAAPYSIALDSAAPVPFPPPDRQHVRLAGLNVQTANRSHGAVRDLLLATRPDVVGLLEVNERWLGELREVALRYPFRIERPQENNFGIALWSRFPMEDPEIRDLGRADVGAVVAHFALGATPITLALAHPVPPVGGGLTALRDLQLDALGELRDEFREREFILLGDLNATPWSAPYRRLERASGLRNAARWMGWQPTWPAWERWLGIPIDHCLVSEGLQVLSFGVGEYTGSDHLPLLIDLGVWVRDS